MSASMESIIAAALASHQWYDATTDSEDPATGCTGCDDWFGDENAVDDGIFAAHQARAVLAAISEAAAEERLIYTAQQLVNTTAIRDYFANGIERAEKGLIRRRDELAVSLCLNTVGYDHSTPGNQRAIDMIIQLQDEAAK